jgi:hypothetical protein
MDFAEFIIQQERRKWRMNYIKLLESLLFKLSDKGKVIVISWLGKDLASCWEISRV